MQGFGIFRWPNGKRFEGEWMEGKKHGFGITYNGSESGVLQKWEDGEAVITYT